MSDFGDFDELDAFDVEPADPEQVAILLYRLDGGRWEDLTVLQGINNIFDDLYVSMGPTATFKGDQVIT